MERITESLASFHRAYGSCQVAGRGARHCQALHIVTAEAADEKSGYFELGELSGTIDSVIYRVDDSTYPMLERDHEFSFREYVDMGKPRSIAVRKEVSYEARVPQHTSPFSITA